MAKSLKGWLPGINLTSSMPNNVRRRRAMVLMVVSLVGFALSLAGYRVVDDKTRSNDQRTFEQEAGRIATDMETRFNLSLEHLRSIPPFFSASKNVSREEFLQFVSPTLERNTSQYVSAYLPRVAHLELADFEAAAASEGLVNYTVRSVDIDGLAAPLQQRDFYFPIYYVEPLIPSVLGIDVGSHPEQAKYLEAACLTDEPVVTPPLSLIEDPQDVLSVMAFISVRSAHLSPFTSRSEFLTNDLTNELSRDHCVGIAIVILKVRPLVEVSMGSKRHGDFQIVLIDPDADPNQQLVHKNFPGNAKSIYRSGWPVVEQEIHFADQTWALTLSPAFGSPFAPGQPPYWILIAGGLLSLLVAYSLSATIAIGGLRKQVDQALQLGQYRLGKELGEGGMGVVYEASHEMLARPAAIKLIRSDHSKVGKRWQSRFEREAQATAGLQSPHTVSIYDFGKTQDDTFYYVMERLDGVDLATLVDREGPLSPARTVHLLRQICHSLGEAHASGLIHRDIKPANIFVCKHAMEYDFIKVLDFGLVKSGNQKMSVELTQAGTLLGTPAYMAPEMIQDQTTDGRSDLYSLGCVTYFMLTGKTVFEGTLSAIIAGHVKKNPPRFSTSGISIPPDLEQVVFSCLAKHPEDRPINAMELARRLSLCDLPKWTPEQACQAWRLHSENRSTASSRIHETQTKVERD